MIHSIQAVLFDLDGTLIDTAPDMANALDLLCDEHQQARQPFTKVRPIVSDGSEALVKLAFGTSLKQATLNHLKQRYLAIYEQHLAVHSQLFDEMEALLLQLEKQKIKWGVVTNKPEWLTLPLMQALKLKHRAACIVSADSTKKCKPHPQPMFYACKLADVTAENCLYVGDAQRDIEAGNNAGMTTVVASYGYIPQSENIHSWQANHIINSPAQILKLYTF